MILYHGTSSSRGQNILAHKMLDANAKRVYDEDHGLPTTNGYVYLTDDVFNAIYYGNKTAWIDKDDSLYVFRIEINDSLLEADFDEFKYTLDPYGIEYELKDINNPTIEESLRYTNSVRVGQDIKFEYFKTEFMKLGSTYPTNKDKAVKKYMRELLQLRNGNNDYINKEKMNKIAEFTWSSAL